MEGKSTRKKQKFAVARRSKTTAKDHDMVSPELSDLISVGEFKEQVKTHIDVLYIS